MKSYCEIAHVKVIMRILSVLEFSFLVLRCFSSWHHYWITI
jgi:hypothetical protein